MHSRMQSTGVPGMECSRPQSASPTVPVRVWSLIAAGVAAGDARMPAPRIRISNAGFLKLHPIHSSPNAVAPGSTNETLKQQRPHLRDEAVLNFRRTFHELYAER